MMKIVRMKKTGQMVHEVHKVDSNHTMVLFPFTGISRRGNRGVCQPVRNDNLVVERQEPGIAEA